MERLWDAAGSLSVREVLERLTGERKLAYTTVMTVLDNLHRKGLVTRKKDGRAYRSRPVSTREQYTATLMEEVLATGGDRGAALLHFVGQMSAQEAARLRAALEEHADTPRGAGP